MADYRERHCQPVGHYTKEMGSKNMNKSMAIQLMKSMLKSYAKKRKSIFTIKL